MFVVVFLLLCIRLLTCCNGEMLPEVPDNLQVLLKRITPYFEETLKRGFINEGIHIHDLSGSQAHPLDDVLEIIDNNVVELRNLKLTRTPDFKVNNFALDLTMFTLNLELSTGQLKIEGEYEVTNKSLQKILPISQIGKIVIVVGNVICSGRVGIYITEDSFVVENYDMKYKPTEILMRVSYFKEDGIEVDNEITELDMEKNRIIKSFWIQLTDILTSILHRQLAEVVVRDSIDELLSGQTNEPDQMRDVAKQRAAIANRLFDPLLCTAKTYLVDKSLRNLEAEPLKVVFKSRPPGTQQGSLETNLGQVLDMATLTRVKRMSILEEGDTLIVYGNIELREFKFNYDYYKAEYGDSISEGNLNATVYRNRIFVKLLIEKNNNCRIKVDNLQFKMVSDIYIDILGLGSLSWLRDRMYSWAVGHLRNKILLGIEKTIKEALQHAISTTNCNDILIR